VVLGLDTRFLGRKWQKKNDGKNKTNKISQLHLGFFDRGRAVPCNPGRSFGFGKAILCLVW
jgi:hypothetical protein